MIKVHPLVVRGRSFDVFVQEDGQFYTTIEKGNVSVRAVSLDALRQELMKKTKQQSLRLRIAALKYEHRRRATSTGGEDRLVAVTITGLHAGNNNVLVRDDRTGAVEQVSGWEGRENYYRPMGAEERLEFFRLKLAEREAAERFEEFKKERQMDIEAAAKEAVEKATAGGEEE